MMDQDVARIRRLIVDLDPFSRATISRHELSGRNRIYRVDLRDRDLFVKLPGDERYMELQREPIVLGALASRFRHMPAVLATSTDPPAVAIALVDNAETVGVLAGRDPARALSCLAGLAGPLAELHSCPVVVGDAPRVTTPLDPIWYQEWLQASAGARSFVRKAQASPAISSASARALSHSGTRGLIHGDLKSDNVLVVGDRTFLIDFELAGDGEILSDISAVLGSLVTVWLDQLDVTNDASQLSWAAESELDFDDVVIAAREFIQHYEEAVGSEMDESSLADALVLWLVSRGYAASSFHVFPPPSAWLMLQVAHNIAKKGYPFGRP